MPIHKSIKASVVDINSDTPKPSDRFFVDTNVLFWMGYSKASHLAFNPLQYQVNDYPNYTDLAIGKDCKLFHTGLCISELVHLIEYSELKIFNSNKSEDQKIKIKTFRNNYPIERCKVHTEIKLACEYVTSTSELLSANIDLEKSQSLVREFDICKVDGYDFFNLKVMHLNNITQIITDDSDFACIDDITLFTANQTVIRSAKKQGKLVTRR
ncbi:hypothetical protein [Comamonas sp. MYb396]|uniref:hypothetical protein n=1 Tax=Comamonas sp. MYb396 TaxID=2745302 RepID=UPI0030ACE657